MAILKVGLAPFKTSYYDERTNTYITLDNPVREIHYTDKTDLLGICHACNGLNPALILYKGKFPKATLDEWKSKYENIGKQATDRADRNQEKSGEYEKAPEEPKEPEPEDPPVEPEEPPVEPEDPPEGEGDTGGEPMQVSTMSMASTETSPKKEEEKKEDAAKTDDKAEETKKTTKKTTRKKTTTSSQKK